MNGFKPWRARESTTVDLRDSSDPASTPLGFTRIAIRGDAAADQFVAHRVADHDDEVAMQQSASSMLRRERFVFAAAGPSAGSSTFGSVVFQYERNLMPSATPAGPRIVVQAVPSGRQTRSSRAPIAAIALLRREPLIHEAGSATLLKLECLCGRNLADGFHIAVGHRLEDRRSSA